MLHLNVGFSGLLVDAGSHHEPRFSVCWLYKASSSRVPVSERARTAAFAALLSLSEPVRSADGGKSEEGLCLHALLGGSYTHLDERAGSSGGSERLRSGALPASTARKRQQLVKEAAIWAQPRRRHLTDRLLFVFNPSGCRDKVSSFRWRSRRGADAGGANKHGFCLLHPGCSPRTSPQK